MLSKQHVLHDQPENVTSYQDLLQCPLFDSSGFVATAAPEKVRDPLTTFTALLAAAQLVEVNNTSIAASSSKTTSKEAASLIDRRLRNRVSCRKSRLKRKLQQHELNILVRERQERKVYLTQVSNALGLKRENFDDKTRSSNHQDNRETLFREFATKSLHYALVDHEYTGWLNGDMTLNVSNPADDIKCEENDAVGRTATSSFKRPRLVRDNDVFAAVSSHSISPQTALFKQWRPIVDGLQNLELNLLRMEENDLGYGVFERFCYWHLVGVSSVRAQRDGEVVAVAVNGTSRVRFNGRQVQEVNVSVARRNENVPYDLSPRSSGHDGRDSNAAAALPAQ